ncbi:MAG: ATP-binding protein [Sediminibacterium sp.]
MSPEFQYLYHLIQFRLGKYFPSDEVIEAPVLPLLDQWQLPVRDFVWKNELNTSEAILLLMALAPHVQPDLFDSAIENKLTDSGNFPRLGGVRGKNSRTFLPTGETAVFILADDDLDSRLMIQQLFGSGHLFSEKKIIWLEELSGGEPVMSGRIIISQDYIDTFTLGKPSPPHFSISFPARRVVEERKWSSLVIDDELQKQIEEITGWLKFNDELMDHWGMHDRIRKGYRALFYGPPGTGKTLTAGLLGNEIGKAVYKIDLSMIVSKYIGETEKNLELLFARAEDKGWILFFDEADALFGKRTNVRDAHDKYANQEVSYLLQRIEEYNGLIILATNMKSNIDDAFMRRFNAILKFPFPDANDRALIWKKSFPEKAVFEGETVVEKDDKPGHNDIYEVLKKYELTGGNIINIVHYAGLKALERRSMLQSPALNNGKDMPAYGKDTSNNPGDKTENSRLVIHLADVLHGVRRELSKEGKPFLG